MRGKELPTRHREPPTLLTLTRIKALPVLILHKVLVTPLTKTTDVVASPLVSAIFVVSLTDFYGSLSSLAFETIEAKDLFCESRMFRENYLKSKTVGVKST
jgi:hypothetical protein